MNEEILKQAMALFNTPEKWNAFLELQSKKDEIRNKWYSKFQSKVCELTTYSLDSGRWDLLLWNQWDIRWFIKEFGKESICFWYSGRRLHLWGNGNLFNTQKAFTLLKTEKYLPILNIFHTKYNHNGDHLCFEDIDFVIQNETIDNIDKLAWYAGNKTEEIAHQLVDRVSKFRTPEITELLIDLNHECKK